MRHTLGMSEDTGNCGQCTPLDADCSLGDIAIEDISARHPVVRLMHAGKLEEISCDFVAGCDGYHCVCRQSVPDGAVRTYERLYPFGWLGILA